MNLDRVALLVQTLAVDDSDDETKVEDNAKRKEEKITVRLDNNNPVKSLSQNKVNEEGTPIVEEVKNSSHNKE